MRSGNTAYIERLDHLRFFAAALVLLFHAWLLAGGETRDIRQFPIINEGHVGVHLFMVISGFILAVISHDKQLSAPRFYLNRALRIIRYSWWCLGSDIFQRRIHDRPRLRSIF